MLKSNKIWLGAAALVLAHFAQAQSVNSSAVTTEPSATAPSTVRATPGTAPAATAVITTVPNQAGQPSDDPIIQRRLAKKHAKAEYKAQKKAAKQEYKEEKQEANANLKAMRQTQGLQPSGEAISSGR